MQKNEWNLDIPPAPKTRIWIASDTCIDSKSEFTKLQVFMARFLLGWRIEKIDKGL